MTALAFDDIVFPTPGGERRDKDNRLRDGLLGHVNPNTLRV
jgi:hypothetical protein